VFGVVVGDAETDEVLEYAVGAEQGSEVRAGYQPFEDLTPRVDGRALGGHGGGQSLEGPAGPDPRRAVRTREEGSR